MRAQRQLQSGGAPPAVMARLPESISLEIVRAPAEYAVPVKQDRCAPASLWQPRMSIECTGFKDPHPQPPPCPLPGTAAQRRERARSAGASSRHSRRA